jgi:hypothetical protein
MFKLVERDKVHIMIFDDFIKNPDKEFSAILNFLALDDFKLSSHDSLNERKASKNQPVLNLVDLLLRRLVPIVAKQMNTQRDTEIYRLLRSGNRALRKLRSSLLIPQKTKSINSEQKRNLADVFREDIELLSELLGRDMTYWIQIDD